MTEANTEPAVENGQSTEPVTDEGQSAQPSEQPAKDSGENWWDVSGLDEKRAKNIKSAQAEYTKTRQELAEAKAKAAQVEELTTRYNQLQATATEVLKDPKKYEQYRREVLGLPDMDGVKEPPVPKKVETVGDLIDYINEREKYLKNELEQKYNVKLTQEINKVASPVYQDRWESALNKMRGQYQGFKNVETKVAQMILNGPYKQLYGQMDEKTLLDKVYKAEFADQLIEDAKQTVLQNMEKKKQSTTAKPKANVHTTTQAAKTREEIIQRVNERLGK